VRRWLVVLGLVAAVAAPVALAANSPLAGNYETTLKSNNPLLNALWEIQISKSGSYLIYRAGHLAVGGKVTVVGTQVKFVDNGGGAACTGKNTDGYYTWRKTTSHGQRYLHLKRVSDHCSGRAAVLSTQALEQY
jgi:hypothetical protein